MTQWRPLATAARKNVCLLVPQRQQRSLMMACSLLARDEEDKQIHTLTQERQEEQLNEPRSCSSLSTSTICFCARERHQPGKCALLWLALLMSKFSLSPSLSPPARGGSPGSWFIRPSRAVVSRGRVVAVAVALSDTTNSACFSLPDERNEGGI